MPSRVSWITPPHDMPLAIRGGGHSLHGFGVCDSGLVVDLSDLRGIHVDTKRLIEFNFRTSNSDEVNWYLHEKVGCRLETPDRRNFRFRQDYIF